MAKTYNVRRIVDADGNLDVAAYRSYSPLYIPCVSFSATVHATVKLNLHSADHIGRAAFAISYGLSFASITATITHALLYYRKRKA